jgi:hypothetical protein
MYKKLKDFASERKTGKTSSTVFERFRFFKEEKNRIACVKNLKTWNKRLAILIKPEPKQHPRNSTDGKELVPPFSEIRNLFGALLSTFGEHWDCNCSSRHEVLVCLKAWPSSVRHSKPKELDFELLFPEISNSRGQSRWLESTVLVSNR